ncbi:MAG: SPFH domain-containing protein [Polyangiaceae bacterium]|nr:SPFH domain-containing protein [Polyangiaceae bacterium]
MARKEIIIKDTHRGLWYEDGVLSEDILRDAKETSARYGVSILRADVKDLVFPGNLQEIMNKVLAAERTAQAQLVEARTKAQSQQIDAQIKAEIRRIESEAQAASVRTAAAADADALRIKGEAELAALKQQQSLGEALEAHPSLLRLRELESLRELARNANARLYVGFAKHVADEP